MSEQSSSTAPEPEQHLEFIKTEQQFDELIEANKRIIVDFYADWCEPCKMMKPTVSDLAAGCDTTVAKADVEALPQIAMRYGVMSIPTFISFNDG